MIETPLAILNVREIAAVARDRETRLSCLVIGTNDLAKEMRARIVPGRAPVLPLLVTAILAARAYGLDILDGPFNDLANAAGLRGGMRAGARHRLRRQDPDPSEPDRAPATRRSRRARKRSRRRARSSPRSTCRRTRTRASSRSTAAWSSGCTPTWRGARWRSPTRSRNAGRNGAQGRHRRWRAGGLSGRGVAARQEVRRVDRDPGRRAGAAVPAAAAVQGLRQGRGEGEHAAAARGGFLHRQRHRDAHRLPRCRARSRRAARSCSPTANALAYDSLVLATGGRVRQLPVPGAELAGVAYVRTLGRRQGRSSRRSKPPTTWWWSAAASSVSNAPRSRPCSAARSWCWRRWSA